MCAGGCGCGASRMGMPCHSQTNSMVEPGMRAPDTMRYGQLRYEVVGSDYATHGVPRDAAIAVARPLPNPFTNQAGMLAPLQSAWGQTMRQNAHVFVREMNPIEQVKGFPNNVGYNLTRTARNIVVVADPGYDGILPLRQQPVIDKPLPY